MIPIVPQERTDEHGPPSDTTPNEQLGQNIPDLSPDKGGSERQNVGDHEDQVVDPERTFDNGQFGEDAHYTARSGMPGGEH